MEKYLAIIEKSETGFGAYIPDLPGCIAVAETEAEVKELIEEAVDFHIEGLREPVNKFHSLPQKYCC